MRSTLQQLPPGSNGIIISLRPVVRQNMDVPFRCVYRSRTNSDSVLVAFGVIVHMSRAQPKFVDHFRGVLLSMFNSSFGSALVGFRYVLLNTIAVIMLALMVISAR